MAVPLADLEALDWVYHAQPFANLKFDLTKFGSLDSVFHAQPMLPVGTEVEIPYADPLIFAGGL